MYIPLIVNRQETPMGVERSDMRDERQDMGYQRQEMGDARQETREGGQSLLYTQNSKSGPS